MIGGGIAVGAGSRMYGGSGKSAASTPVPPHKAVEQMSAASEKVKRGAQIIEPFRFRFRVFC
jgi:hypothetical protein